MKINIEKKKTVKPTETPFDKIPVGCVYVIGEGDGSIALKLKDNEAVLLMYSNKDDWFTLADGFNGAPATKILGKLTGITVKETE